MLTSKSAFVIMPFSATINNTEKRWTTIFNHVFKKAFSLAGYECRRAAPKTGSLIKSIIQELRNAEVVLADITDQNPNVFYELGVRHSLSKRTIIVAQKASDIPSDLRGYWAVTYGTEPDEVEKFCNDISELIKTIEKNPDKIDNPVMEFIDEENIVLMQYSAKENAKKLTALCTELNGNITDLKILKYDSIIIPTISTKCIDLLLTTFYVDLGPVILKKCFEFNQNIALIKFCKQNEMNFVEVVIKQANDLLEIILNTKNQILMNQFIEPENITTMEWKQDLDLITFDKEKHIIWDVNPPKSAHFGMLQNINPIGAEVKAGKSCFMTSRFCDVIKADHNFPLNDINKLNEDSLLSILLTTTDIRDFTKYINLIIDGNNFDLINKLLSSDIGKEKTDIINDIVRNRNKD